MYFSNREWRYDIVEHQCLRYSIYSRTILLLVLLEWQHSYWKDYPQFSSFYSWSCKDPAKLVPLQFNSYSSYQLNCASSFHCSHHHWTKLTVSRLGTMAWNCPQNLIVGTQLGTDLSQGNQHSSRQHLGTVWRARKAWDGSQYATQAMLTRFSEVGN